MTTNTPDRSDDLQLVPKHEGLDGLIKTLVRGEDINVGDTILAWMGISREALEPQQEAAIDTLEEAVTDALNGRFRHGQARMLSGFVEDLKDIHCYTQPKKGEEGLQGKLQKLVGKLKMLVRQEGGEIENMSADLGALGTFCRGLVAGEPQISEEGSTEAIAGYVGGILREKDIDKEAVVRKVFTEERGLFDLLEGLLKTQLAKICQAKPEALRSATEDSTLRILVFKIIEILCSGTEQNKAKLIQEAISGTVADIKAARTRSDVSEVMAGGTGEEPEVNLMPRGTMCNAGKKVMRTIEGSGLPDEETPSPDKEK